jgi:hypothetical protein
METYASSHIIKYFQFQHWVIKYNDLHKDWLNQLIKLEKDEQVMTSQRYKLSYG